jgi:hypothetical protein
MTIMASNPQLDYTFRRTDVFLGTTADDVRVFVSGRLSYQPVFQDRQTIDHGTASNPENLSVSVVAFTGKKNVYRNLANGLHSIGHFGPKIVTPAPGFTIAEVRELVAIGQYWHGNAGRAHCAHMELPKDTSYDARRHLTCPVTGYRYGRAWLAEPLPDEVRTRFLDLMEQGRTEETDY